jgi:transposase InsO family protein
MRRKRHSPEQVIAKLCEADVALSQGVTVADVCKKLEVSEVTYDRWRAQFIAPGSPWENAYIETFNGKLQDELLQGELFTSLTEACWLAERWRHEYNEERPHSSLGYQTPARFAAACGWTVRPYGADARRPLQPA